MELDGLMFVVHIYYVELFTSSRPLLDSSSFASIDVRLTNDMRASDKVVCQGGSVITSERYASR